MLTEVFVLRNIKYNEYHTGNPQWPLMRDISKAKRFVTKTAVATETGVPDGMYEIKSVWVSEGPDEEERT